MGNIVKSPKFIISKLALEPNGVVNAPFGNVLMANFEGAEAFAYIEHAAIEQRYMQLATMPTGGPYELETDADLFHPAHHVASFLKTAKRQIVGKGIPPVHVSSWHVYCWLPTEKNTLVAGGTETAQ